MRKYCKIMALCSQSMVINELEPHNFGAFGVGLRVLRLGHSPNNGPMRPVHTPRARYFGNIPA